MVFEGKAKDEVLAAIEAERANYEVWSLVHLVFHILIFLPSWLMTWLQMPTQRPRAIGTARVSHIVLPQFC